MQHTFFVQSFLCRCFARRQRETSRNFLVTRFMEEMLYVVLFTFFSLPLIFTLVAASISHFLTAAKKCSCYSSNEIGLLCFLISGSSSFSVIHANVDFKIKSKQKNRLRCCCFLSLSLDLSLFSTSMKTLKLSRKKESSLLLLLLLFISKSPGGYAIYCRNARVLEMQNVTPAYMKGTRTCGRTDDFLKPGFHQRISTSTCASK